MDVHHHSHTSRKKWTHYLWEFLMLFLAVFLGFLAENQREHFIEHKRAKEYAINLYKDLQRDIADITRASIYEQKVIEMIDSLILYSSDTTIRTRKNGLLYYYMRLAGGMYTVDFNKATLNQLINSGNLRYFINPNLNTLISSYNTTSAMIIDMEEEIENNRIRAISIRDQIIKAQYALQLGNINMDMLVDGTGKASIDSLRNADFPLQSNDSNLLNSYMNALFATKGNRRILITRYYPRAIREATDITQLLKKEYSLK